ncbi:unnamed protein product [Trichobilharzia regenti]|nr:unnamed protein product [Trichobilharzia regenti]
MFVCEHPTATVTRLSSSQSNNFTNKLHQPVVRSTLDNLIAISRHQQTSLTPSVLSVQSLHGKFIITMFACPFFGAIVIIIKQYHRKIRR